MSEMRVAHMILASTCLMLLGLPGHALTAQHNYCNETDSSSVLPQIELKAEVANLTPNFIANGKIITTDQLTAFMKDKNSTFILVDAWSEDKHKLLPGAIHIPYAGQGGNFHDDTQTKLFDELSSLTGGNSDYPIIFYCAGSNCWESYNAALRAEAMNFSNVYWYRGGSCSWQDAHRNDNFPPGGGTKPAQRQLPRRTLPLPTPLNYEN